MDILSLFLLSCALAMDSFAVSLCKGFSVQRLELKHYIITAGYFGGFAVLMFAIGYVVGVGFEPFVRPVDHWIAFILLTFLGLKMIKESFGEKNCSKNCNEFSPKVMFGLAIATSIDALAVGISFAFLNVNLFLALFLIGLTSSVLCTLALKIGNSFFEICLRSKAGFLGGVLLTLIGLKILIEHLFFD